jgi:mannose-1-phosphate guanylyltransferase
MVKSVILIGGPYKKGNFSPFDMPAPLIPVSGLAMICHHLYALSRVPGLKDVFLYGYYDEVQLMNFISQRGTQSGLHVQYVEELRGLGTGGALAKEIDLLMKEGYLNSKP